MAADVTSQPRLGAKAIPRPADGPKKLPRPIVFWSLNEKTAYRRNRVVQTRMNMIIDDIATQRETSRKTIRYEAHKFRQKSSRYYSHPLGTSAETQAAGVNIAPPNWRPPNQRGENETCRRYGGSDDEYNSDEEDDNDNDESESSPRKLGIITRGKKPVVSFSMSKEVHQIENDLKIDDLDSDIGDNSECKFSKRQITRTNDTDKKIRSISAMQHRDVPELPGQNVVRQQSAFPSLRNNRINSDSSSDGKTNNSNTSNKASRPNTTDNYTQYAREANLEHRPHTVNVLQERRSENYFDKSKAAYQLRQDLKKRAKMRKQGVKTSIFTLQDALSLEKEKFLKSKDKVVDYMKRIEAIKRSERTTINRWTVQQLVT